MYKGKENLMLSKERQREVTNYMRSIYSLTDILKETGVWDNGPIPITCPFHPDSRPSFYIDLESNSFKCYSCGSYGSYASFYHEYKNKVEEDSKSFAQHIEDILKADKDMQESVGFTTIFVKSGEDFTFENALHLDSYVKYQPKRVSIHDYATCLDKLKDVETKLDAIADIEMGMSENDLWDKYINNKYFSLTIDSKDMQEFSDSLLNLMDEDDDDDDDEEEEDNRKMTKLF